MWASLRRHVTVTSLRDFDEIFVNSYIVTGTKHSKKVFNGRLTSPAKEVTVISLPLLAGYNTVVLD
jgi:hypothetical protein